MKKIYFLSFCFLIVARLGFAQQNKTISISVNLQQATIGQFVTELEAKTGYHFYYSSVQFDSLKVSVEVNNKSIETVLDMAFKSTDFHYAVTEQHQVFLTRGREIQTKLP